MGKTFKYEFTTKRHYSKQIDEFIEDCVAYEYEPQDDELLEGVVVCVWEQYFRGQSDLSDRVDFCNVVTKGIEKFIEDNDLLDELVDLYEDELKEYFEETARENYDFYGGSV